MKDQCTQGSRRRRLNQVTLSRFQNKMEPAALTHLKGQSVEYLELGRIGKMPTPTSSCRGGNSGFGQALGDLGRREDPLKTKTIGESKLPHGIFQTQGQSSDEGNVSTENGFRHPVQTRKGRGVAKPHRLIVSCVTDTRTERACEWSRSDPSAKSGSCTSRQASCS